MSGPRATASSPLAPGPSPLPLASTVSSVSPRPASASPQPPRRQPSVSPRPSHAPSPSFVPAGPGYPPSQPPNPPFAFGSQPSHNAADPNAAQRRGPRPSYTPLKLAGHNSTPSVALDPAAFAASLVAATASKPAAPDKPHKPAPMPIDDVSSISSSPPAAAQAAPGRSPAPPAASPLLAQPATTGPTVSNPALLKKAPQYVPLKLSGHNSKPSVSLDPLAFAASLDTIRPKSAADQDSKISTISEAREDDRQGNQMEQTPSQPSCKDASISVPPPAADHNTASNLAPTKPQHARTATLAPGAIQVMAQNPSQARKRYVISLPPDHLFGSSSGPPASLSTAANSSPGSSGSATASVDVASPSLASVHSDGPVEVDITAHSAAVRAAWRPRVPLSVQLDLALPLPPTEPPTSVDPAPIATPIGLVEAAADASAAAAAARAMQPQNMEAAQAAAEAEAAAEAVAAEEAHEAALETGLTTGHSSLFVYDTLGLPETIDIFLPGQAAWGDYRAERSAALAAQAEFAAQVAQMTQIAQMGVSANDMPPLPTGESALSAFAGDMGAPYAALQLQPPRPHAEPEPGHHLLPPPVFEGPMNRPPPTVDESDEMEQSAPALAHQTQSNKLVPKWLANSWSRSPGKDSATSPSPSPTPTPTPQSENAQNLAGSASRSAHAGLGLGLGQGSSLGTAPGGSPQPPAVASAAPGPLTLLQRLSGAAKRASLSLTNYGDASATSSSHPNSYHGNVNADKDHRDSSGRSLPIPIARSPQPEEATEFKGYTSTGTGSMLSALGFGRSRSTSPQPAGTSVNASANVNENAKPGRLAWQSLGAGFGYDVPPAQSSSAQSSSELSVHDEKDQSHTKDDMEDVDMRTNPSEDGDTSSMGEGEHDRLQRDFPAEGAEPIAPAPAASHFTPSGRGQRLPTTVAFSQGRTSSSSKYAPTAARAPSSVKLNAAAPSFTPGSRAPSASFTFVAPSAAPKMASPTVPAGSIGDADDGGEQGREKRFRGSKAPAPVSAAHPTASARISRRTGSHASTSIPPNLFVPPAPATRKLEIRAPEPGRPAKALAPQQAQGPLTNDHAQADVQIPAQAAPGLSKLHGSPVPVSSSSAGPLPQGTAVDTDEEGDMESAHRRRRSQAPSHSSDRAAMAAKLSQAVRTATQRHAAHASSTSVGSRGLPSTPAQARLASDVASSALTNDPVAAAVASARAEAAEAEDIVEQIVGRLDASLDAWARRILARVDTERTAALAHGAPASAPHSVPMALAMARRSDALLATPTRSTMRGTPLPPPPGASPLVHPGRSFALSPPAPSSESGVESESEKSPEILARVEHGVRNTFSNYLKLLPGLGARDPNADAGAGAGARGSDGLASAKTGSHGSQPAETQVQVQDPGEPLDQAQDQKPLVNAPGSLDFDYVEEMLCAKVHDLEAEVLHIVKDGLAAAVQARTGQGNAGAGAAENGAVAVSMSSEEVGKLADVLDERMRSTFDTAQVELLRMMSQPSPAVLSALSDTEAAINAHTASFLATQHSVEELLQTLPAKFDAASETFAGAGQDVATQVQASVVSALQPQLDGLRASSDHVDGEVLAARVITALVPMLEGRHDELPDRIADAVAGHLRADLRTQVQMQMQAHLQAQAHDAEATRDAALRRLALPPPSVFAPSSAVSTSALSSPPPRRERDFDSFDVASTTAATTVVEAPAPEDDDTNDNENDADAGNGRPAGSSEIAGQGKATGSGPASSQSNVGSGGQALTPESLAELAKVLTAEMRVSGVMSLDPIVERLDPLVSSQEKTWNLGKDLLAQQGELAGTLRAIPASLGAKTDVFLAATRETHQTQKVILERLMHVADANHAAQVRITELEEAASKRSDALSATLRTQAQVTGQLKEAQAELSATNKYMTTLKEEVDDLENRLETAQANAITATEQLRDAHSRLRDAVEARHAAERSSDEIRRRMVESEAEIARAQSAASLASTRADDARASLEREREDHTAERARAQTEAADLRARVACAVQEAEEANSRLESYVEDAQQIRAKAAADVARAETEAAKGEGALSVAQARTQELDTHNQDLVQALATQKQTAASAQQRSADSDRRMQAALTKSAEMAARVSELEKELHASRANEERLCADMQQLNTQFEAVETEVSSMKETLVSKNTYEDARKDAELARCEADTMRAERDDLRAQLDTLRAEMMARTTAAASSTAPLLKVQGPSAASPRPALREVQDENTVPSCAAQGPQASKVSRSFASASVWPQEAAQPYDWSTNEPIREDDDGWWS